MKLAQMDQLAISGSGSLHRLPVATKLLGSLMILGGIILAWGPLQLGALLALLTILLLSSGLPGRVLLPLACYPAVFSLPFALVRVGQSWSQAVLIPGKAVAAALVLLLVIASTPYPRLLGAVSRVLPPLISDVILLTYRLFFIMLGSVEQLLTSMRLRGAFTWHNLPWSIGASFRALGLMFLETIAAGERMYQTLELRGYQGKLIQGDDEQLGVNLPEGAGLCLLALAILGVLTVG